MSGSGAASWVIIPNWGSRQHERMDGWIKDTITPPPLPPPAPPRVNSDPPPTPTLRVQIHHPPICDCAFQETPTVKVLSAEATTGFTERESDFILSGSLYSARQRRKHERRVENKYWKSFPERNKAEIRVTVNSKRHARESTQLSVKQLFVRAVGTVYSMSTYCMGKTWIREAAQTHVLLSYL